MAAKDFVGIVDKIQAFCNEATLSVSLWGEPAYHSEFADLAAAVLEKDLRLIVETSGIGWQEGVLSKLADKKLPAPDWVVSLDSRDPQEYRSLRGEGFGNQPQITGKSTLAGKNITMFPFDGRGTPGYFKNPGLHLLCLLQSELHLIDFLFNPDQLSLQTQRCRLSLTK